MQYSSVVGGRQAGRLRPGAAGGVRGRRLSTSGRRRGAAAALARARSARRRPLLRRVGRVVVRRRVLGGVRRRPAAVRRRAGGGRGPAGPGRGDAAAAGRRARRGVRADEAMLAATTRSAADLRRCSGVVVGPSSAAEGETVRQRRSLTVNDSPRSLSSSSSCIRLFRSCQTQLIQKKSIKRKEIEQ